ncbi:bolA-like protein [Ditylenchus destructor]|nr:bolA-like protein [Ditylenchus destructor]
MASSTIPTAGKIEGPVTAAIRKKLADHFNPAHLEVECESAMHNVAHDKEIHFRVQIVCDKFEGLPLLQRQRLVNKCLADELKNNVIHALRIDAKQPSEFLGQKQVSPPACGGGGGK